MPTFCPFFFPQHPSVPNVFLGPPPYQAVRLVLFLNLKVTGLCGSFIGPAVLRVQVLVVSLEAPPFKSCPPVGFWLWTRPCGFALFFDAAHPISIFLCFFGPRRNCGLPWFLCPSISYSRSPFVYTFRFSFLSRPVRSQLRVVFFFFVLSWLFRPLSYSFFFYPLSMARPGCRLPYFLFPFPRPKFLESVFSLSSTNFFLSVGDNNLFLSGQCLGCIPSLPLVTRVFVFFALCPGPDFQTFWFDVFPYVRSQRRN